MTFRTRLHLETLADTGRPHKVLQATSLQERRHFSCFYCLLLGYVGGSLAVVLVHEI
jgi:hypothetical protein